jgi:hypothetical protein
MGYEFDLKLNYSIEHAHWEWQIVSHIIHDYMEQSNASEADSSLASLEFLCIVRKSKFH